MIQKFYDFYFYCVLRRSYWVLGVVLVITTLLASQLPKLKIDASADALTLEYDRDLDYFREISKRYQSGDFLVVTYKPHNGLFDKNTLAQLRLLRDELKTVPGIESANSILDVPLLYSPPVTLTEISKGVKTLQNKLDQNSADFEQIKNEFLESPLYREMLLGPDGKTTAILLNIKADNTFIDMVRERDSLRLEKDKGGLTAEKKQRLDQLSKEFIDYRTASTDASHKRVKEVRSVLDKYDKDAKIFLGGVSMITADMVTYIRNDITVFGTGIIIFIILMLSFIFRQWQFVVLPLVACCFSLITMLGFLAAIDWRLTVISSNFVALQLIICLAVTIHLIVRYREYSNQRFHVVRAENVRSTVMVMFYPCLYTLLTTLVAFASLVVSGIRPVIDFGWMMVIGMTIAFAMAFLVIPVGLILLPRTKPNYKEDKSSVFTLKFSRFTEKYGQFILVTGGFIAVLSALGMNRLEVENRFIDYFHSSTEIHQGMLVIDQQLGGTITLDVIIEGDKQSIGPKEAKVTVESDEFNDSGFGDPFAQHGSINAEDTFGFDDPFVADVDTEKNNSYWFTQTGLEKVEVVHDYFESLSEVGKVQSLAMIYKVITDLNGREPNDFELALVRRSLPEDITNYLVEPYLSEDIEQTRLTMRIRETDENLRRATFLQEVKDYLVNTMGFAEDKVHLTGVLVLYNNMLQSLFRSQILTLGAVFIGIMAMFLVLFRSFSLSLIALTPNLLAAMAVLGGMGLVGIPLDMMTITIAAIAIGIGVDDAIHYIYRFKREFKIEKNYTVSMHNAHASIGQAMYYTSVTVIAGFSILALSEFIPSIYFGLLTSLAMLAAIVASLTLLPKLILLFKPFGVES